MPVRNRRQEFSVGSHTIRLEMPLDLEQFSNPEIGSSVAGVSREAFPLFGIVWASSELLAHLLLDIPLEGRRVLEVGCGMGLASHLLNARCADITALDIHPVTADYMSTNTRLNKTAPIPIVTASWSDAAVDLGKFDLIVGADILYEPKHVRHLPDFLLRHTAPVAEIIIVDPARGLSADVMTAMQQQGFAVSEEVPDFTDHLGVPFNGRLFRLTHDG